MDVVQTVRKSQHNNSEEKKIVQESGVQDLRKTICADCGDVELLELNNTSMDVKFLSATARLI